MEECQACAELEAQCAGDGGADGQVDAAFGARGVTPEALRALLPPQSAEAVEFEAEPNGSVKASQADVGGEV